MIWSSESIDSVVFYNQEWSIAFCSLGGTVFWLQYISDWKTHFVVMGPWNKNISFLIWIIVSVFSISTVFFSQFIFCIYRLLRTVDTFIFVTFSLTPNYINLPHHCKFTMHGPPVRNIWLILVSWYGLCKSTDIIIYLSQSLQLKRTLQNKNWINHSSFRVNSGQLSWMNLHHVCCDLGLFRIACKCQLWAQHW